MHYSNSQKTHFKIKDLSLAFLKMILVLPLSLRKWGLLLCLVSSACSAAPPSKTSLQTPLKDQSQNQIQNKTRSLHPQRSLQDQLKSLRITCYTQKKRWGCNAFAILTYFKQSLISGESANRTANQKNKSPLRTLYPTLTQIGQPIRSSLAKDCALHHSESCLVLAMHWEMGLEGPQDREKSRDLYEKACKLSQKKTPHQSTSSLKHPSWGCIAWAYQIEGEHLKLEKQKKAIPVNLPPIKQVQTMYKEACEHNLGVGCDRLGGMHQLGIGVKKSMKSAFKFYKKACQNQWMLGCTHAGFVLSLSSSKRNQNQAHRYFTQACQNQEGLGCTLLGLRYLEGKENPEHKQEPKKAQPYFDQACQAGELLGCVNLGILYALGTSGQEDKVKARRLFRLACDHQVSLGCKGLDRLQPKNKFNFSP